MVAAVAVVTVTSSTPTARWIGMEQCSWFGNFCPFRRRKTSRAGRKTLWDDIIIKYALKMLINYVLTRVLSMPPIVTEMIAKYMMR